MIHDEAQELLMVALLLPAEDHTAEMREALALAERNPELGAWLAKQTTFDEQVKETLVGIEPPAGLRARLIQTLEREHRARRLNVPQRWLATAAAAVLLLALGAMGLRTKAPPEFAVFRDEMIQRTLTDPEHLTFTDRNLAGIRQWLKERGVDGDFDLPAGLRGLTPHGCRILDWNGQKVALICLVPKGAPHVDLLVIDRTRFREFTPSDAPQFGQSGGLAIAVWSKGNKTYLLTGKLDTDQLRHLL